ncbi:hypothetical protein [Rhodococcus sp. MEB041]|uniref:hypothetical protein n=1 Tax=Rhodococcus sp. MEB041 TaxID=3040323 RepID=UPI00254C4670|nr:hypothetical protein [Rhodococcus sp. MEB041]
MSDKVLTVGRLVLESEKLEDSRDIGVSLYRNLPQSESILSPDPWLFLHEEPHPPAIGLEVTAWRWVLSIEWRTA